MSIARYYAWLSRFQDAARGVAHDTGQQTLTVHRHLRADDGSVSGDVLHARVEEFATPPGWQLLLQRLGRPRRPGLLSILLRAGMVNAEAASQSRRLQANLLLTPPLADVQLLEWEAYEKAIALGYEYARQVMGGERPRELP